MSRTILITLFCSLILLPKSHGQEVVVPRQLRKLPVIKPDLDPPQTEPSRPAPPTEPIADRHDQSIKSESVETKSSNEQAAKPQPDRGGSAKVEVNPSDSQKKRIATKQSRIQSEKAPETNLEATANVRLVNGRIETASTKLADGFDFPVGKPDAEGYYKARGYRSGGHMGEDWDGVRGGDTDLGDPIYSIGDGIVVFARDVHLGWGNVVIVRHAYREDGTVKHIDSLYGHLESILVKRGQRVARGQKIATMGTAHGQYDAHLHLEIRKNLEIGMSKAKFAKNLTNYFDPSQFISSHRHITGGGASFRVAMNTFTHDAAYHFDNAPNFAPRKRSTSQSASALKRAVSSTSATRQD